MKSKRDPRKELEMHKRIQAILLIIPITAGLIAFTVCLVIEVHKTGMGQDVFNASLGTVIFLFCLVAIAERIEKITNRVIELKKIVESEEHIAGSVSDFDENAPTATE